MRHALIPRLIIALLLCGAGAGIALTGVARAALNTPTPHPSNPCAPSSKATPMETTSMGGSTPASVAMNDFDLLFLDLMIPHHQSAIAMAKIAVVRADHPEIVTLAEGIITSQQAEIDQMTAWRAAWYPGAPMASMDQLNQRMNELIVVAAGMQGTPHAGMGSMHGMGPMMDPAAETQALCNPAGSFDETFLQMMIPHHLSAVAMAQVAQQQATHPEIRTLAKAIIAAQQGEIAQMTGWLSSWYAATPQAS